MAVRLSQVHDTHRQGLISYVIQIALEKGRSAYVGEGLNRWTAVHRLDAARLFRLAVEQGEAGDRFHAVAEEGLSFRAIAEAIGQVLHLPVVSLSSEEAPEHFGWLAGFAGMDLVASSLQTRRQLGWNPTGPGLLTDLANLSLPKA